MNSAADSLSINIERDSVCAGDDCDAPHRISIRVHRESTLAQVLDVIQGMRYLAQISGGRATWIVESFRPLAVVAEQWKFPRFLVSAETRIADCLTRDDSKPLFFRYWCQVDPDLVFDCLQSGRPLPNQFERQ